MGTRLTGSFSDDRGNRLETMVLCELHRKQKALFYYNENGHECDFVVMNRRRPEAMSQV